MAAPQSASARLALVNRRDRLRDFQAGLAEKLKRAEGTPLAVNRLGLQIGTRRLLVDLADAGEILTVPAIMPVPLTKSWYRGLANVRGNLFGVVDLSLFAGGPPTPIDKESRLLAFSSDLRFACGILVSRMLGLRSAADLRPAADAADSGSTADAADSRSPEDVAGLHPVADPAAPKAGPDVDGAMVVDPDEALFAPWVRARLVDAQATRWQEIDLAALVADPRFLDIART